MRSNCELYAKRMRFYATAYELYANGMRMEYDRIRTTCEWNTNVMQPNTNRIRIVYGFMLRKEKQRKEKQIKQKQTKIIFKFVCEF